MIFKREERRKKSLFFMNEKVREKKLQKNEKNFDILQTTFRGNPINEILSLKRTK